ncbi:hypothetical protein Y032_1374g3853, partial [Ancylostoma ceylanicum]
GYHCAKEKEAADFQKRRTFDVPVAGKAYLYYEPKNRSTYMLRAGLDEYDFLLHAGREIADGLGKDSISITDSMGKRTKNWTSIGCSYIKYKSALCVAY